jgi:hypothetical protein
LPIQYDDVPVSLVEPHQARRNVNVCRSQSSMQLFEMPDRFIFALNRLGRIRQKATQQRHNDIRPGIFPVADAGQILVIRMKQSLHTIMLPRNAKP